MATGPAAALPCQVCGLYGRGCRSPKIEGEGPVGAAVMIVGDYPGFHEDLAGRPWVGPAGKLLRDTLQSVGIAPESCRFSNALRCRPCGGTQHLGPDQWRSCLGFLRQEIREVNPRVLFILGEDAAKTVVGVGTLRGGRVTPHWCEGRLAVVSYNPAAGLRDTQKAVEFARDAVMVARAAVGTLVRPQQYRHEILQDADAIEAAMRRMETAPVVACDLETSPLYPYRATEQHPAKILCLNFSAEPGTAVVVPWQHREVRFDLRPDADRIWRAVKRFLEGPTPKVWQNGIFDCCWLLHFGIEPGGYRGDTLLGQYLLDEQAPSFGLAALCWRYTDVGDYWSGMEQRFSALKAEREQRGLDTTYDDLQWQELAPYSALDADVQLRVWQQLRPQLEAEGLLELLELVYCRAAVVFARQQITGVLYCRAAVDAARQKLRALAREQEAHLRALPKVREFEALLEQEGRAADETGYRFNPGSPQQLSRFLYQFLQLPAPARKRNHSEQDSTAVDVLRALEPRSAAIRYLIPLRKVEKYSSTYVEPYYQHVRSDGLLHTSFRQWGTRTGRISTSDPNFLNIPREGDEVAQELGIPSVKSLWISRFRDGLIGEADLSQAEVRVFAQYCGDPALIDLLRQGGDVHRLTAARMYGKRPEDVTKPERQGAKAVVFATLYGGGPANIAERMQVPYDAAVQVQQQYFAAFPLAAVWMDQQRKVACRQGYVTTLTGQRRRLWTALGQWGRREDEHVARALRQALNSPIQGTATHLCQLAMIKIDELMRQYGLKSLMILHVYDSVVFDLYPGEHDRVKSMALKVMTSIRPSWLTVPLEADWKSGPNWGAAA